MREILRAAKQSFPFLYRQLNRYRGYRIHDPDVRIEIANIGGSRDTHSDNYGAWAIPRNLSLNSASVVYGFGVGHDISFDLGLIRQFGCEVHAFDPGDITQYFDIQALPEKFKFHQYGLGIRDGIELYQQTPWGAFEEVQDGSPHNTVAMQTRTLPTIMKDLGHHKIDLLKMDIEGFEYNVIDNMIKNRILPECLLIEFHHFHLSAKDRTEAAVNQLRAGGYRIFWISDLGSEYGFIAT
jgi:FkbM family methyltransferase